MAVILHQGEIAKSQRRLHDKIHETILAIDNELSVAEDVHHREMLVKSAYSLMNLETRLLTQKLPL